MQEDNRHRIHRHVQLPGGRQIEVVYLDSRREPLGDGPSHPSCAPKAPRASSDTPVAATPWTGDSPRTEPGEALHVCPRCAGGLVHPLDWVEESPGCWRILMRCPDCDLRREGVFGGALVERLDEELDRATGALLSDLKQLTHANMTEEVELFSRALQLDLIGPSDF
jgi:hypothetical protein